MTYASSSSLGALSALLRSQRGVTARLAQVVSERGLPPEALPEPLIQLRSAAAELEDRATGNKYPQLSLYVDRVENLLTEKFRRFSGRVDLAVEIRVSQDRIADLEQQTQAYVDSVTAVLEDCRGEWAEGVYYSGKYEIKFGAVKRGGRNFLQTTIITAPVEVSRG